VHARKKRLLSEVEEAGEGGWVRMVERGDETLQIGLSSCRKTKKKKWWKKAKKEKWKVREEEGGAPLPQTTVMMRAQNEIWYRSELEEQESFKYFSTNPTYLIPSGKEPLMSRYQTRALLAKS